MYETEDVQAFLRNIENSSSTTVLDIQINIPNSLSNPGMPRVRNLRKVKHAKNQEDGTETLIYETQDSVWLSNPEFLANDTTERTTLYDATRSQSVEESLA